MRSNFVITTLLLAVLIAGRILIAYTWNRDLSARAQSLQTPMLERMKAESVDYSNESMISFKEGQLRTQFHRQPIDIRKPAFSLYYKPLNGEEKRLSIPEDVNFIIDNRGLYYIDYPYLFLVTNDLDMSKNNDRVLVYNLINDQYKQFDVLTPFCGNAWIVQVAHEAGELYWKQYKDWSLFCNGYFSKKLNF